MIAILAENYHEYKGWLQKNFPHEDPVHTRTFVYAFSQVRVMGMNIHAVIEIGTAHMRNDYVELRRELAMRMAVNRGRNDELYEVS